MEGRRGELAKEKEKSMRAEEELLRGVVLYHREEPFDAVGVREELAQDVERLFEMFAAIVDGLAFEASEEYGLFDLGTVEGWREKVRNGFFLSRARRRSTCRGWASCWSPCSRSSSGASTIVV